MKSVVVNSFESQVLSLVYENKTEEACGFLDLRTRPQNIRNPLFFRIVVRIC